MTEQTALVLEEKGKLSIRDIDLAQSVGPDDVQIAIHTVGICGSDVHYYTHGRIGQFVVNAPMVLGHEAAGTVTAVGDRVSHLAVGDRVCMEPGIPDMTSRASKLGIYNVDPAVTFWATPPIHGCLTPSVVHPAAFTYKLPDNVSFAEGAMVEPFAIGMQAAAKAKIVPGDVGLVIGAGPIGVMTALAALAGGCARVMIYDVVAEKLQVAGQYEGVIALDPARPVDTQVLEATGGWGADVVFECSGHPSAFKTLFATPRPGGCVVFVGMPVDDFRFDLVAAQAKELRMETVFRYANVYDRAIELIASGKIDLKPLISGTFPFEQSVEAFDRAVEARPTDVKLQITLPG
ncbi:NAD(P)-dependent alcohol dehydrogenase [Salipiger abyssi]|uniref:NAD(P)-dependent alcohol dehydrogenase n=1 Tax=Salipiger abyssi TaxID=1250539 RepID=UPI001A8C3618|nr:NAD(P)-dependent alcohol dehydrogenase [Salipiger abyssi]MBN9887055.1 NAD(P)-dependent alcohol dehydrogenase [Salipiger abyssi]